MGSKLSTQKGEITDVLKFFEEELKKWNDNVKNLKVTWETGDRSWVPAYLGQQMEETETRWINIKSLIVPTKGNVGQRTYPGDDSNFANSYQQILKQKEDEINRLQRNNETLLQNKQKIENDYKKLQEKNAEYENMLQKLSSKAEDDSSKSSRNNNGKSTQPSNLELKHSQHRAEDVLNSPKNVFLKRMMDFEEKSTQKIEELKTENETLIRETSYFKQRVECLEKDKSDLLTRSRERLETERLKQQNKETPQQNIRLSEDTKSGTQEVTKETLRKRTNEMEEEILTERSKNETLTKENDSLKGYIKCLEQEKAEMLAKYKEASESINKDQMEHQRQHHWEAMKKHEKQTGRDSPVEQLGKQFRQMENEKLELLEQRNVLEAQKETLETYVNQLKEEKDELLLRLSKFAGDKLVDNNPAITDLSDPNRPTKLAEFYSELYDNEWTNAFEALVESGYEEVTAIETLRLTLQNVLQFCESKADLLLQKASDAVNLLFEEYRLTVLEMRMPSHLTMPKQQARDVGQFFRREKSSLEDIKLQRMWEPYSNRNTAGAKRSCEKVQKEEHSKLNAKDKLKQLRKDMASTMVPIVQKAYIEASWTNRCIEELKPYILKCLYLGWMMVVQSPPMVLHKCSSEREIQFDKNFYKEYTASGPLVDYIVWPALLLNENGPLVCKGVAEGKKP